jgi:hypothetical protein
VHSQAAFDIDGGQQLVEEQHASETTDLRDRHLAAAPAAALGGPRAGRLRDPACAVRADFIRWRSAYADLVTAYAEVPQ